MDPGSVRARSGRSGRPHPTGTVTVERVEDSPSGSPDTDGSSRDAIELLATCWTHAGDAAPVAGRHLSPLNLGVRAEAVAAAGFTGIGFTIDDLAAAGATY